MVKSQKSLQKEKEAAIKERDELAAVNKKLTEEKGTAEVELGSMKDQLGKSSQSSQ